jgi:hypothetical protein
MKSCAVNSWLCVWIIHVLLFLANWAFRILLYILSILERGMVDFGRIYSRSVERHLFFSTSSSVFVEGYRGLFERLW